MCPTEEYYLKSRTFKSKIKKQLMNTAETQSFEGTMEQSFESLRWIFIVAFALNFVLSFSDDSGKYMLFMIKALQIIMHLSMYRFVIPSNFGMMSEIISPILMFDILNNNKGWDANLIFAFD